MARRAMQDGHAHRASHQPITTSTHICHEASHSDKTHHKSSEHMEFHHAVESRVYTVFVRARPSTSCCVRTSLGSPHSPSVQQRHPPTAPPTSHVTCRRPPPRHAPSLRLTRALVAPPVRPAAGCIPSWFPPHTRAAKRCCAFVRRLAPPFWR